MLYFYEILLCALKYKHGEWVDITKLRENRIRNLIRIQFVG
jgi:hypothetical protein